MRREYFFGGGGTVDLLLTSTTEGRVVGETTDGKEPGVVVSGMGEPV